MASPGLWIFFLPHPTSIALYQHEMVKDPAHRLAFSLILRLPVGMLPLPHSSCDFYCRLSIAELCSVASGFKPRRLTHPYHPSRYGQPALLNKHFTKEAVSEVRSTRDRRNRVTIGSSRNAVRLSLPLIILLSFSGCLSFFFRVACSRSHPPYDLSLPSPCQVLKSPMPR